MTDAIFTPKADDKFAAASVLPVEVITVKPSGYIQPRGVVPTEFVAALAEDIRAYYAGQGRGEPAIFTRPMGAQTWVALDTTELVIPDELPEEFTA